MRMFRASFLYALLVILTATIFAAQDRTIQLDDVPQLNQLLAVSPDGGRVFLNAGLTVVYDAQGKLVDRFSTGGNSLLPLENGWFILSKGHAGIYLLRPDGSEAKLLVGRGGKENVLRDDMTGWTSPCGAAIDEKKRLIFAIDTSMAVRDDRNIPDPCWSRIGIWDFDGKYIGDINRYDAMAPDAKEKDDRRLWYTSIAVDSARQHVYVGVRKTQEVLSFDYDGKLLGKVKAPIRGDGMGGGFTVLPDGRLVVGGSYQIQTFDPDLKPLATVPIPAEVSQTHWGVTGLACDAAGRLYARFSNPEISYVRWSADFARADVYGPRYVQISVGNPTAPVVAGNSFAIKVSVKGRPAPGADGKWEVLARPADGSDLRWKTLRCALTADGAALDVTMPDDSRGIYDFAARYINDNIRAIHREDQATVKWSGAAVAAGAQRSLSVFTSDARRAYQQGEAIPLQVVARLPKEEKAAPLPVTLSLQQGARTLATAQVVVNGGLAVMMPASVTRRLATGEYRLAVSADGYACYGLQLTIAAAQATSPMQRILYHEMGDTAMAETPGKDTEEQLARIRDWAEKMAYLGFDRETDRVMGTTNQWRPNYTPANVDNPGLPPAEYLYVPGWGQTWRYTYYLNEAVKYGLRADSTILSHCSGVRFRDYWLNQLTPRLQQDAQARERFPSFYGFNYNDEMFFGQWVIDWSDADVNWLKQAAQDKFNGSMPDAYRYALRVMYDAFNNSVQQANPQAQRTATPMWQFPAVEGSYAPEIYKGMTESYAHYLSEGYQLPWYPSHSGEILRRPGMPLRNTVTNAVGWSEYDGYMKNTMQVLARGVQGIGTSLLGAFDFPNNTAVVRATNKLATMYGPLFAEFPPLNEAAILYSYTQDVTERRAGMGTPHWERVFCLYGANLMAGIPSAIVYEEDVKSGWLLQNGKPRVAMLFLVGQKQALPAPVQQAVANFQAAGGKVLVDKESAAFPGALKMDFDTRVDSNLGYAADTAWPLQMPVFAQVANNVKAAAAAYRRYPLDTDVLWMSKNAFDGGAIRYIALAPETEPFPWQANEQWSLGCMYNYNTLPHTVSLTMPAARGAVVYNVLEHRIVKPKVKGDIATLAVDMRTFPGAVYAVAPAKLGAPRLALAQAGETLNVKVRIVDAAGKPLAARVPLRIRLYTGATNATELYRGTGADGTFTGMLTVPATAPQWTLEVAEMLGGMATAAPVKSDGKLGTLLAARPDVEVFREDRLQALIEQARQQGKITLVMANDKILSEDQQRVLRDALAANAIKLEVAPVAPKDPAKGLYLAAGFMQGLYSQGDILWKAWSADLYPYPVTELVPGPGRGFFTAVFAPRGAPGENAITLVGGDADGLTKTVVAFAEWLKNDTVNKPAATPPAKFVQAGKPAAAQLPRISDEIGIRLTGVTAAADGKHLLVKANGYLKNLALIEDTGASAKILKSARVGQAYGVNSEYLSADGATFGASARELARYGEGFHLFNAATGDEQVFAAFGAPWGKGLHHFAVSADGARVIAPGSYGAVCWQRDGGAWKEAWAIDYWQEFSKLDWPLDGVDERMPQFHAFIPKGADYALILFAESTNNGWVQSQFPYGASLRAVNLADGKERWRFDVPILKIFLQPTLYASPDGSQLLLKVQIGSWGARNASYRFYSMEAASGTIRGEWEATDAPLNIVVADGAGTSVQVFDDRHLEVRDAKGQLVSKLLLKAQPLSVAFTADGNGLYFTDDMGKLNSTDLDGTLRWQAETGTTAYLAATATRLYTAGRDGRLRAFDTSGKSVWTLDCTPAMDDTPDPVARLAAPLAAKVIQPRRAATTATDVPAGASLLNPDTATIKVGGTGGWMSHGANDAKPADLMNGKTDDGAAPWIPMHDIYWDADAGRQVWAEIDFKAPTDVNTLTVYENQQHPEAYQTEGVVQRWDDGQQKWVTAAFGVFMNNPVNTFTLNLKGVTKLRYVPWGNYYRNFYISELEVR